MRRQLLLSGALLALTLSACGGTSTTVVTTGSSTTGASTSSATGTATTGSHTALRPAGRARCTAAALHGSFLGQQGAVGHGELGFSLRNTSGRSCHTFGYPGVLFLSASGHPLPTATTRTTHDFFGQSTATGLDVAPGARVSFRLGVTHEAGSPGACRTAAALQVIPPDDTVKLRVPIPGGGYECGTTTVSPLQRGATALR
ncbi:MAG: DUF4232 domain-containing protein [Actinomycetota bacterium]|nr:DUF4232 domain-containing protein [Actinomycetota bacterium]